MPILGITSAVTGEAIPCNSFFADTVVTPRGELKVYRCDWGWYVRSGEREARSRYLDAALEQVVGGPLDHASLRALIDLLDRELTAERDRTGKTASRELPVPSHAPAPWERPAHL
jgi:hypothetical protein